MKRGGHFLKNRIGFLIISSVLLFLSACISKGQIMDGDDMVRKYVEISQEKAMEMMQQDDGHIVIDVRRPDEYASGHIPGAVCIPNESIGNEKPEELPDLKQIILVYCRSGNRSKEAAEKLFLIGYENIYEFGGIIDWTGETVTEESTEAREEVPETGESTEAREELPETGESTEAREEVPESTEAREELPKTEEEKEMKLKIGSTEVPVTWEDNLSVEALMAIADKEPLTIQMSRYGGFEQVGPIGQRIVNEDRQTTTGPGDIVLYSGNQIVIFYGSNSWAYTRLGHVDLTEKEMMDLLGKEDVLLTIETN